MVKISGFADEISKDVQEQIDGLRSLGIRHTALRGAWGKNVMDWTEEDCARIRGMLDAAGIGVSEIGSPVGKDPIDEPFERTAERLAKTVRLAKFFRTPNIRMFSFYPPEKGEKAGWEQKYRGEV
ncbi:MAG: sugar phosphate isomerase/epimerase, partial [Phycisphaerae bacterium]|nr:sugar phosphate isomerase/epimerase [Phycisphaerae bacterium]